MVKFADKGSGWHGESARHSRARRTGKGTKVEANIEAGWNSPAGPVGKVGLKVTKKL